MGATASESDHARTPDCFRCSFFKLKVFALHLPCVLLVLVIVVDASGVLRLTAMKIRLTTFSPPFRSRVTQCTFVTTSSLSLNLRVLRLGSSSCSFLSIPAMPHFLGDTRDRFESPTPVQTRSFRFEFNSAPYPADSSRGSRPHG